LCTQPQSQYVVKKKLFSKNLNIFCGKMGLYTFTQFLTLITLIDYKKIISSGGKKMKLVCEGLDLSESVLKVIKGTIQKQLIQFWKELS
jgi:hypothetical protein